MEVERNSNSAVLVREFMTSGHGNERTRKRDLDVLIDEYSKIMDI